MMPNSIGKNVIRGGIGLAVLAAATPIAIDNRAQGTDTARIDPPQKLTLSFVDPILRRELVSGKVIGLSGPISYRGILGEYAYYGFTLQSQDGKVYAAATQGRDLPNLNDEITTLLGFGIDMELAKTPQGERQYRTLVAYSRN